MFGSGKREAGVAQLAEHVIRIDEDHCIGYDVV